MVLCVDERSQIEVSDRTQTMPPMRPGAPQRLTCDCKRNGTTSLFSGIDSWINQVERWFVEITRRQIRRCTFWSTLTPEKATKECLA